MMRSLRQDALKIVHEAIQRVLPEGAMKKALADEAFSARRGKGRVVVAAIGKAAWRMARAAADFLGPDLSGGAVVFYFTSIAAGQETGNDSSCHFRTCSLC